jgi:hypothetical protein
MRIPRLHKCYFGCWLFVSPCLILCSPIKCGPFVVSLTLQKGYSLLFCLFIMYAYVVMVPWCSPFVTWRLRFTTWSRLFTFFVSLFYSISFFLFFILFLLFCHLAFLVFLSSVSIQLIRSCGGYFSIAKRSSSRAAFVSSPAISFPV